MTVQILPRQRRHEAVAPARREPRAPVKVFAEVLFAVAAYMLYRGAGPLIGLH